MKTILVVMVLFVTLFPAPSWGQTTWFASNEWKNQSGHTNPNFSVFAMADSVTGKTGTFAFVQVTDGWAQGYAGLNQPINKYWSVGLGLGSEQGAEGLVLRVGVITGVYHPRYTVQGYYEHGETDWYRLYARYHFGQSGFELGPAVEYDLGPGVSLAWSPPITIWCLPSTVSVTYHGGKHGDESITVIGLVKQF